MRGGALGCVCTSDADEFIRAPPSSVDNLAARLGSAKAHGHARLFTCVTSPLSPRWFALRLSGGGSVCFSDAHLPW